MIWDELKVKVKPFLRTTDDLSSLVFANSFVYFFAKLSAASFQLSFFLNDNKLEKFEPYPKDEFQGQKRLIVGGWKKQLPKVFQMQLWSRVHFFKCLPMLAHRKYGDCTISEKILFDSRPSFKTISGPKMHLWCIVWCDMCVIHKLIRIFVKTRSLLGKVYSARWKSKTYSSQGVSSKYSSDHDGVQIHEFEWFQRGVISARYKSSITNDPTFMRHPVAC